MASKDNIKEWAQRGLPDRGIFHDEYDLKILDLMSDLAAMADEIDSAIAGTLHLSDDLPQNVGTKFQGSDIKASRSDHVHAHGNQLGGSLHSDVDYLNSGFMPATDKMKLDNIESGANRTVLSNSLPTSLGISSSGTSLEASRADHVHAHGNMAGGSLHALASGVSPGFMDSSEKTKLGGIEAGATNTPYSSSIPLSLGTADPGVANSVSRSDHVHAHGNQLGGTLHSQVTTTTDGFMIANDKLKLNNIAAGATNTPLGSMTPNALGTASSGGSSNASREDHIHAHGNQLLGLHSGSLHELATHTVAGFMDPTDKVKIDNIPTPSSIVTAVNVTSGLTGGGAGPTPTIGVDFETNAANFTTLGTAAVGASNKVPRSDHTHPAPSGTAGQVYAAPSGSSGAATLRNLVASDIPALDASKITSGTVSFSLLPVETNAATFHADAASAAAGTSGKLADAAHVHPFPSASANQFFASPDGLTGQASFRNIGANDLPNIDASKITSGTVAAGRLPISSSAGNFNPDSTTASAGSVGMIADAGHVHPFPTTSSNYVFAGPDGSSGQANFRLLTANDVTAIDASKITTGTISTSRLPIIPKTLGGFGQDVSTGLVNDQVAIVVAGAITLANLTSSSIPSLDASKITTGVFSTARLPIIPTSLGGFGVAVNTGLTDNNVALVSGGAITIGPLPANAVPNLDASKITTGTITEARGGTGQDNTTIGTGLVSRTGLASYTARTITGPAAGISVTNGNGVSGNPTLSLTNDLAALEGLSGTGLAVRTGTDTWTNRSIVAGTGTTVTNGDGISGNPSINVSYGSSSNTATQGNDSRLNPTPTAAGKIPFDNGTGYSETAAGTTSQVLVGGTTPAFGSVPLAAIPSGIDAANIGTGVVNNTEFGYLDGVTSSIQTQLNGKQTTLTLPLSIANGGTNSSTGDLVATNQLTAPLLTTSGGAALNLNSSGTAVNIKLGGSSIVQVGSSSIQTATSVPIVPASDLTTDFGGASTRWNALYANEINSGSSTTLFHTSNVADGSSAVANRFNNTTALANSTAKLASFRSNNVEKTAILSGGGIQAPSIGPNPTNQHTVPATTAGTVVIASNAGTTGQVLTSTGSVSAGTYADPITGTTGSASLSGSSFTLNAANGTYQDIGLSITLPSAGTYLVTATVKNDINMTTGAGWLTFKLQNSTDTTDISNSERMGANATQTGQWYLTTTIIQEIVTVNASKTIKVLGKRDSGTTYAISQVTSSADGRSRISYVKLNYV